jgi:hypothetical protein
VQASGLGATAVGGHAAVWLPHALLATLQARLSESTAALGGVVREPQLRPLARHLDQLLALHTAAASRATLALLA